MALVLKNYMEDIVEDNLDSVLRSAGCCACEACRLDVKAWALNQLKPVYVVSEKGGMFAKLNEMTLQFNTDVIAAIAGGINVVNQRPRHQ